MLRRFLRHRGGSVLPTFAIALVPLIVATGAVVDFNHAYDERTVVQDAMDNAALAAGKQIGILSTDEVKAEAVNFFRANVAGRIVRVPTLVSSVVGSTVELKTTLHVDTYFLGLIGMRQFTFNLESQVTQAMGTLEIALVLDNSSSMAGSKIETLKVAATNLTNTIFGLASTSTKPDPVKVALVPFGGSVNVGPSVTWVDTLGKATYAGDAVKGEGALSTLNPYALFAGLKDTDGNAITWGGCVEERPAPYDISDDPPSTAVSPTAEQAKTLFLPMFAPDEPDSWTCSTSNCDYVGSTNATRRYNGVRTGNQSYNNYLPDAGSGGVCGPEVQISNYKPAKITQTAHGLAAGTQIAFQTTGTLPSGITEGDAYTVSSVNRNTNDFLLQLTAVSGVTIALPSFTNATISKASPGVMTTTSNHGLAANQAIRFASTGTLPSPLVAGTTYYVKTVPSSKTFTVSATSGGSAINTTTNGSGTHSYTKADPAVFTKSGHGLAVGDPIYFETTGSLPTPITASTLYYVKTVPSTSTFTIATTAAGAGLVVTGTSQSGMHSFTELVSTTSSGSGKHTYTKIAEWTCQSGSANCNGTGDGISDQKAFAGLNVSGQPQCKYGTASRKATVRAPTAGMPGGPNYMCTTTPIQPLTTVKDTVTGAISKQVARGYTNITAGVMWGWRVLSDREPFTEGRAKSDYDNNKIMVVMTDGENTYYPYVPDNTQYTYTGKFLKSAYGAWGYIYKNHLGTTSNDPTTIFSKLNERTAAACEAAKNDGVKIYTVAFNITDEATLQMLRNCASTPQMAYQSNSEAQLLAAFTAIGENISLLRLAR